QYGGRGGGLANTGRYGTSNPIITNVLFVDNSASIAGPGVALGGAMYNGGDNGVSNPVLTDVTFRNNTVSADPVTSSAFGGAVYNDASYGQSSPVLTNVTFEGNTVTGAEGWGAALYNHGFGGVTQPQLTNVTFSNNNAYSITYSSFGGAIYNNGFSGVANVSLTNVTIANNSASGPAGQSQGGGIYFYATDGDDSMTLNNTILWGNTAAQGAQIGNNNASITFDHGIVEGACPANVTCIGISMINPQLDPLADNGGPTPTMQIPADSSAVDTGSETTCPNTDQRGVSRPQLNGCDIGAVEYKLTDEDEIFADSFDPPAG